MAKFTNTYKESGVCSIPICNKLTDSKVCESCMNFHHIKIINGAYYIHDTSGGEDFYRAVFEDEPTYICGKCKSYFFRLHWGEYDSLFAKCKCGNKITVVDGY